MTTETIIFIGVGIYVVLMLGVGVYAARKNDTAADFKRDGLDQYCERSVDG